MVVSLAVALLVGGVTSSALDDYPIVDAPIPVFAAQAAQTYLDDVPIVQDRIAAPWEPLARMTEPRCGCDGIAVPDGW